MRDRGFCSANLRVRLRLRIQPNDIGYSSPAAALSSLRSKPAAVVTEKDGCIIPQDKNEDALWTIAKPGNSAYPAAIKRYVANREWEIEGALRSVKAGLRQHGQAISRVEPTSD